uniref:Uncharacterized protein n=1 Tax=Oryza sativa subsp. japonica TaxID=39947 RepID=Q2QQK2_ORYSJ|nr:hypothetical protein LOC_Os12g30750 [Oryza sativa Japonica Group]
MAVATASEPSRADGVEDGGSLASRRGWRRGWWRRLPSPPTMDGVEDNSGNGSGSRGLPPRRWSMMAAATVVVNDGGGERGRGKRREGREVKLELTVRSHVQLRVTEIFYGKRDGVALV